MLGGESGVERVYFGYWRGFLALSETCPKCGWAIPAKTALDLCNVVEKVWGIYGSAEVPALIRKTEGIRPGIDTLTWRYLKIRELISILNAGRLVHKLGPR